MNLEKIIYNMRDFIRKKISKFDYPSFQNLLC